MSFRYFSQRFASKSTAFSQAELVNLDSYWTKAIDWYADYYSKFSLKMYRSVIPFLHLDSCRKLLEIGGGIGLGAEILLPHLPETSSYTLVSHVQCMADRCKAKNLPKTEVLKVDPLNLPFSGESFDRFVSLATFEEFSQPHLAIQESYRVLEPGGILVATMSGKQELNTLGIIFNKIRSIHKIEYPMNYKQNLGSTGSIKKAFQEVGFQNTFVFTETVQYTSVDVEKVKDVFLMEPYIKEAAERGMREAIEKSIKKELNNLFFKEGMPLSTEFLVLVAKKPNK